MKERLLEEIQKGSKGAVMKKHIITYLIYNPQIRNRPHKMTQRSKR